jgi:hypothetical protein
MTRNEWAQAQRLQLVTRGARTTETAAARSPVSQPVEGAAGCSAWAAAAGCLRRALRCSSPQADARASVAAAARVELGAPSLRGTRLARLAVVVAAARHGVASEEVVGPKEQHVSTYRHPA